MRAYDDNGTAIGSSKNSEAKIWLLPQAWAVYSQVADEKRKEILLKSVEKHLKTDLGYLTQTPPFAKYRDNIGNHSIFMVRKCVYSHANAFKFAAECSDGRGNAAYRTLSMLAPYNPENPPEKSFSEPYAFANYYIADKTDKYGQTMFGWMTGTCSWVFTTVIEEMLGAKALYDGLLINPTLPSHWKRAEIARNYRKARYKIQIENPEGVENGVKEIFLDGRRIKGQVIPNLNDKKEHQVRVIMG